MHQSPNLLFPARRQIDVETVTGVLFSLDDDRARFEGSRELICVRGVLAHRLEGAKNSQNQGAAPYLGA